MILQHSLSLSLSLLFFHWSAVLLNIYCYISNPPGCVFIFFIILDTPISLFCLNDQFFDNVTYNIDYL